jgi:hypothetical protein
VNKQLAPDTVYSPVLFFVIVIVASLYAGNRLVSGVGMILFSHQLVA